MTHKKPKQFWDDGFPSLPIPSGSVAVLSIAATDQPVLLDAAGNPIERQRERPSIGYLAFPVSKP